MTHLYEMWPVIQRALAKRSVVHLRDLYAAVQAALCLDAEDMLPAAPGSTDPRWKRNVRNVLQQKRAEGKVEWLGAARYRLPGADSTSAAA